ncbi:DegT/DnrJ/EryC1/StrS family aminotransferase [Bacteroidetes/Chlorobi group bacterium ChocPot_Mid]|nr:MAG: DegT/DnrJ/EryC1/StrS family aminotransferase [Bacteroidetes/Chlorobi group bacterium ChocPot_Mid]
MKVPLLDLKLQYNSIKEDVEKAMLEVARSQMLILGKEVENIEKSLADYLGVKYAIGCSSGTDALLMALMALDIKPGDEIIIPTYSFFATAGVVARLNAIPVFVDSNPVTFNIEPSLIKNAITSRTKAIMPVHLYGQCADMEPIMAISREYNIPVIEDGAQAIGCQYKDGRMAGAFGLMGCFSFYPTKNLGGFGDGGLVVTNDEQLADKLKKMRNHGMHPKYYHGFIGGNFRLDALQAAVLNVKYPHLESWHEGRRKNAALYTKYFIESGLAEAEGILEFNEKNKVRLPKPVYKEINHRNYHIYNQYVIHVQKRDELRQYLGEKEIGTEVYYPVPFHRQECFKYLNPKDEQFPVANALSEQTIALPIFPELTEEQIRYVVEMIKEFYL